MDFGGFKVRINLLLQSHQMAAAAKVINALSEIAIPH
jgi:hypothetical protein